MGKYQPTQVPNYQNYQNATKVKSQHFLGFSFPSLTFPRKISISSINFLASSGSLLLHLISYRVLNPKSVSSTSNFKPFHSYTASNRISSRRYLLLLSPESTPSSSPPSVLPPKDFPQRSQLPSTTDRSGLLMVIKSRATIGISTTP